MTMTSQYLEPQQVPIRLISPLAAVELVANIETNSGTDVPYPIGLYSDTYRFVQVTNAGGGFLFVAQGQALGIVPPRSQVTYTLFSQTTDLNITGWDGGVASLTGTSSDAVVIWSNIGFDASASWSEKAGEDVFSGVPFGIYQSGTTSGLAYDGVQPLTGVAEQWHTTFTGFTLLGGAGVTAGKIGTASYSVGLSITQPVLPAGSFIFLAVQDSEAAATVQGENQAPFIPPAMTTPAVSYVLDGETAPAVLVSPPTSIVVKITVVQPPGSTLLGSSGIGGGSGGLTLTQTQLQA